MVRRIECKGVATLRRDAAATKAPLDIESDVQIASGQGSAEVGRGDVLIRVRGVAVRQQNLEVVPADRALESDRPRGIDLCSVRQITILRNQLDDDAQRRPD